MNQSPLQAQVDIIDQQYRLIHQIPKHICLDNLREFLSKWKIPYVQKYNGFLMTETQLTGFSECLFAQFGLMYQKIILQFFSDPFNQKNNQQSLKVILPSQIIADRLSLCTQLIKKIDNNYMIAVIVQNNLDISKWVQKFQQIYPNIKVYTECSTLLPFFMECGQNSMKIQQQDCKVVVTNIENAVWLKYLTKKYQSILICQSSKVLQIQQIFYFRDFKNIFVLTSQQQQQNVDIMFKTVCLFSHKCPLKYLINRYTTSQGYQHKYQLYNAFRNYYYIDYQLTPSIYQVYNTTNTIQQYNLKPLKPILKTLQRTAQTTKTKKRVKFLNYQ